MHIFSFSVFSIIFFLNQFTKTPLGYELEEEEK